MKKLFLALLALFLISCSSSDSSSNSVTTDSVLIKKTIQTTTGSTENPIINNFTYNGNKLNTITSNEGMIQKFFYTGDLITRLEWYVDNSGIAIVFVYTYNDNGKLTNMTRTDNLVSQAFRIAYTHNADGTITLNQYSRIDNSPEEFDGLSKYFMTSTNEIERKEDYNAAKTLVTNTTTFIYDAKNNPFKNILGWNKLLLESGGFYTNVTSIVDINGTQTSSYQYNDHDFPILGTQSFSGNPTASIVKEYIYE